MRDLSEFFDLVPSFANNAASLTLVNQKTYLKVIRPLQNDNAQSLNSKQPHRTLHKQKSSLEVALHHKQTWQTQKICTTVTYLQF